MHCLDLNTAREQLRNAHAAIADLGICAVILDHICQEQGVKTIKYLYAESERSRTPTNMPFGKHKYFTSGHSQRPQAVATDSRRYCPLFAEGFWEISLNQKPSI